MNESKVNEEIPFELLPYEIAHVYFDFIISGSYFKQIMQRSRINVKIWHC